MTGQRWILVATALGGLLAGMIGAWVKVVLGTYSAALDTVVVEQTVAIRMPDAAEVLPIAIEQARGSGHHREAVLVVSSSPQSASVPEPRER